MANETERVLESRIQLRNDTAENWASVDPVLLKGEIGIELDTRKIKVGDGTTNWEALQYLSDDIVIAETDPTETDSQYDLGELWLNQAVGKVFLLIAKTDTAAVWTRIATADELAIVAEAEVAQKLKTRRKIEIAGDAEGTTDFDGSEDAIITLVLKNSGATEGTFTKVTVNEKGLVVKSELLTADDIPELTLAKITDAGTAAARNVGSKAGDLLELGAGGKIDKKYLPPIAITEPFAVASEEEMLALNCQKGDVAIRSDESKSYILKTAPASKLENWLELQTPDCKINSVNGQIGTVVLTTADIEEKDNLYYTEDRAKASFTENLGQTSSADLSDGETILHATDTIILNGGNA